MTFVAVKDLMTDCSITSFASSVLAKGRSLWILRDRLIMLPAVDLVAHLPDSRLTQASQQVTLLSLSI